MATQWSIVAFIPTLGRDVDRLERTIDSVLIWPHPNLRLVVVDNSQDRLVRERPGVELIATGVNLGMVGAMQIVSERYPSDFIWSLQDDMVLLNDCLTPMLQKMKELPAVGACTPVLDHDGTQPAKLRAGFVKTDDSGLATWELFPKSPTRVADLDVDFDFTFVFSSGTLYRTSALEEIGGLDVGLWPLTHVDVDIGIRMSAKGWKSIICTDGRAWHAKGQSTSKGLARLTSQWNRQRISEDFDSRIKENGLGFGSWDPMIARMSHITIELGSQVSDFSRQADKSLMRILTLRTKAAAKKIIRWLRFGTPPGT